MLIPCKKDSLPNVSETGECNQEEHNQGSTQNSKSLERFSVDEVQTMISLPKIFQFSLRVAEINQC